MPLKLGIGSGYPWNVVRYLYVLQDFPSAFRCWSSDQTAKEALKIFLILTLCSFFFSCSS